MEARMQLRNVEADLEVLTIGTHTEEALAGEDDSAFSAGTFTYPYRLLFYISQ